MSHMDAAASLWAGITLPQRAPKWALWVPWMSVCSYHSTKFIYYGPSWSPSHSVLMVPGEDPSK